MKKAVWLVLILGCATRAMAGPEWKLRKESSNMKIYTAPLANSDYKSVKVECTIKGRISQIVAVLFDIDRHKEWVFGDKYSKFLKQIRSNELVYYSEVTLPWPFGDRDFISHLKVIQSSPNVVVMTSNAEPDFAPLKDGIVRVKSSNATWTMTKTADNEVQIDYVVTFDPGGAIPTWLTNTFIIKGPYETFGQLQSRVDLPAYKNARFDFISE